MINYFENDYSIPIILDNSTGTLKIANILRKQGIKEIHVFSKTHPIFKRRACSFHKIPRDQRFLMAALIDYANSINEYYTPLLIYTGIFSRFIEENKQDLESIFIIIPAYEIEKYFANNQKE